MVLTLGHKGRYELAGLLREDADEPFIYDRGVASVVRQALSPAA